MQANRLRGASHNAEIASFASLLVNDHSTSDFSHTQMIFKDLNCLYNSYYYCFISSICLCFFKIDREKNWWYNW